MASYVKRMRELAVPWLAVNPDPSSDVLRLPREFGADEREATMAAILVHTYDPQATKADT